MDRIDYFRFFRRTCRFYRRMIGFYQRMIWSVLVIALYRSGSAGLRRFHRGK